MSKYPVLFQPTKIGSMALKNRLCVPSMCVNFGLGDGGVSQRHLDYIEARARGGFGFIITELTAVDHDTGLLSPNQLCLHDDSLIPGFRKLSDIAHGYGARIAVQLGHTGRCAAPEVIGGRTPMAPSAIRSPIGSAVPRVMTLDDIRDQVEKFAQAARRAREAGFDAVELHGAHGYLIAQFMSILSNTRSDEYGRDLEGFLRFPTEIVKRTRQLVGPDFPLLFRISSEEALPGGRTVSESVEMMKSLVAAGIDAVDVSIGSGEAIQYLVAPADVPEGFNADRSLQFKKTLDVPVLVTGRINTPVVASDIILSGKADLIHMGRQSLADPEWPAKVREGRENEIVKCLSCNECIYALAIYHRASIACVQNPAFGREARYAQRERSTSKKVLVAGGGPAGLEAARTAALRGHKVTLFEKQKQLGGQITFAAVPPNKAIYLEVIRSRARALKQLKADVRLGRRLAADEIRKIRPDVLIIATGSEPVVPSIPGISRTNVLDARRVLAGATVGKRVLIIGGGLVGCETADYLAADGKEVTIVEMMDSVARDVGPAAMFYLMNRLGDKKVKIMTGTTIMSLSDAGAEVETGGNRQNLGPFDTIILAVGAAAVNELEEQARGQVPEVYVIGDAANPARIFEAVDRAAETALGL